MLQLLCDSRFRRTGPAKVRCQPRVTGTPTTVDRRIRDAWNRYEEDSLTPLGSSLNVSYYAYLLTQKLLRITRVTAKIR